MNFDELDIDTPLPRSEFSCSKVQLFLYNAVLFNAHLIHYNREYATDVEGYKDLVVAGPLIGDWLHQCVENWLGDAGHLIGMEYSNRHAAYIDELLIGGGKVTRKNSEKRELEIEVYIKNENNDVIAPGVAVVQFPRAD